MNLNILSFPRFREFSAIIHYISFLLFFFTYPSGTPIMHRLFFLMVSHNECIFRILFSFFSSYWMIQIICILFIYSFFSLIKSHVEDAFCCIFSFLSFDSLASELMFYSLLKPFLFPFNIFDLCIVSLILLNFFVLL